jgi:hypothetical protein
MTEPVTATGYLQTKEKLAGMEARLAALHGRNDFNAVHKGEAIRSCDEMIRQYRKELKLYEATQGVVLP